MKTYSTILPNGLHALYIDTKAFSTITTMLLVGAGSRYETKKNNGIAHFFEHMAFKGSKKYKNSFVISSAIEGIGGVFNAFTSKDHTGYWIKTTNNHFEKVTDVLSDMVLHPLLLEEEINREKGVIIEEINMYEDMPARRVGELFEGLMYPDNALGYDIAGPKENIRVFDRNTFTDYIHNLYSPHNAVLVVAGGLGDEKAIGSYKKIVEEKFGGWHNAEKKGEFTAVIEKQTKPQYLIKYKDTEQAHFCLGFRAIPFTDERKYALHVLTTILGGGMSSRLFMQVRERRGLCYYISTGREAYKDVGSIVTQAGVTNNIKKVKEAIKVILDEHVKILGGKIEDEEIQKAKELIKGRLLISMEDSSNVASVFGTKQLLEEKIQTLADSIKKIESVTGEEIREIGKKIVTSQGLNFSIIGPFQRKEFKDSDFLL